MNPDLDLRQLAVRRENARSTALRRPRRIISRYILPAAVVLGFLAIVGWAARDSFLPSRPVTVVPVFTTRATVQQAG
ncbi:MAG: hemolysin D, partial [Planctomycetota bacterium]